MNDRLLTVAGAALFLSVSQRKVYQLIADGQLKSVKIGVLRRIPESELNRFIQELLDNA